MSHQKKNDFFILLYYNCFLKLCLNHIVKLLEKRKDFRFEAHEINPSETRMIINKGYIILKPCPTQCGCNAPNISVNGVKRS